MLLDGAHECWTLEPPMKTDGSKPRAIDAGTYAGLGLLNALISGAASSVASFSAASVVGVDLHKSLQIAGVTAVVTCDSVAPVGRIC
jgi:hypothetical protein